MQQLLKLKPNIDRLISVKEDVRYKKFQGRKSDKIHFSPYWIPCTTMLPEQLMI